MEGISRSREDTQENARRVKDNSGWNNVLDCKGPSWLRLYQIAVKAIVSLHVYRFTVNTPPAPNSGK